MSPRFSAARLRAILDRGVFPYEFAFILELPWRRLVLSPQKLASRLRLAPESRVLEVGAGSGYYSIEVARSIPNGQLELLDLQAGMLERAARRLEAAGVRNVGFQQANAAILPYPDSAFDLVYLVTVLGEIGDRPAFLREAFRVLRRGGVLSVSEHLPDPDFLRFRTVDSLARRAGFEAGCRIGPAWSYTARFLKPAAQ